MTDHDPFEKLQPWQQRQGIIDRISGGLRGPETGFQPALRRERELLESQAAAYAPNESYERLLKWKAADDPRYDAIDPGTRMRLGFYVQSRDAAKGQRKT